MEREPRHHTLPAKPKRLKTPQSLPPCGDQLHRPCPLCNISTVGEYTIVKQLGTGSYSTVYLASHPSMENPVVLKLLLKSIESQSLFNNEVSILTKVNHPNIVKIHHHFETPDFYSLVLEHVPGRELYDIVSNDFSSLSRQDQRDIFKQIVSGKN